MLVVLRLTAGMAQMVIPRVLALLCAICCIVSVVFASSFKVACRMLRKVMPRVGAYCLLFVPKFRGFC